MSTRILVTFIAFFTYLAMTSDKVPSPQPATPPRVPNFDSSELDRQSPEPPEPATPPSPSLDSAKISWPPHQAASFSAPSPSAPYDGLEYRFKRFVFRPAQYTLDGLMLLLLVLYSCLTYLGQSTNTRRVEHYWKIVLPRLTNEFAQVGVSHQKPYVRVGPATFLAYATGRQACDSLSLKFSLRSRQDLTMTGYRFLRSSIDFNWTGNVDRVEWVWKLSPGRSNPGKTDGFEAKELFVWALVHKDVMVELRQDRWDVRTFTEVKESNLLPSNLVAMSESGDITDQILKTKQFGLIELLKSNPHTLKWFDSLIISGTPSTEPTEAQILTLSTPKTRTITLRLRLPPSSATTDHLALLDLAFSLVDSTHLININILAAQKLAKRRSEWATQVLVDTRKEAEREKEDERRRKMKELQDEKVAKMSASEQKKFDEKERRRKALKMSKTSVKRK